MGMGPKEFTKNDNKITKDCHDLKNRLLKKRYFKDNGAALIIYSMYGICIKNKG
jgi:hypothetical protein